MFLLLTLIPMSFGVLAYLFKKKADILVLIFSILTFVFAIFSPVQTMVIGGHNVLNGIEFSFDIISKTLVISFSIFSLISFFRIRKTYDNVFFSLWLLLMGSINGFFSSRDFFNLYVHLELASISVFLLLSYDKKEIKVWSSLKYMIMSIVALNFYLIGVGILYSYSGTLNIYLNINNGLNPVAFSFIATGILTKSGLFFLSGWLPDAHTQAVKGISPILSGVVVKLALFILYLLIPSLTIEMKNFLFAFAIISSVCSSIFTLMQNDLKRFLAYSTMTQMSYALLVILLNPYLFPHFIIFHMFSKGFLFMIIEDIYQETGTKDIHKLKGKSIDLLFFIIFTFFLLNLSGLFPFSLFFIKDSLNLSIFIDINIFIYGMYFYKIISIFTIDKNKFSLKYWYILVFMILNIYLIVYYFFNFNYVIPVLKILFQYLLFSLGVLTFITFKDRVNIKDVEIYNFQNSFIYQILFLLISLMFIR